MKFDYNCTKEFFTYQLTKPIFALIKLLRYDITVEGTENVPRQGAFILASNHVHFVDPGVHILHCPRVIHYMTKAEAFNWFFFGRVLKHVNCFPINRGRGDKAGLNYAIKLINEGKVIGIFPEGTRSKDLRPHEAKSGIALIARETHADILPASIYVDKNKGHRKMTVRYGKLIDYSELGLNDDSSSPEMREAAAKVMDRIRSLWEEGHCK